MATATKLPSGAWRVQASKTVKGKIIRKSFTVNPEEFGGDSKKAKNKAELLAREWQISKKIETNSKPLLGEAMEQYIEHRKNVISKATSYNYKKQLKTFSSIYDLRLDDIENEDVQKMVNEWSLKLNRSTIQDRLKFLKTVMRYYKVEPNFKITLPSVNTKKVIAPRTHEIKLLLDNAKGDLKAMIALAAFGSLRRGEVAGLRFKDISHEDNTIFIRGTIIPAQDENGKYHFFYRPAAKTDSSIRVVTLPPSVMDLLPRSDNPDDFVFKDTNYDLIYYRFKHLAKKLGLSCSFHSLRHYAASFRSDLQIPAKYIEEVGGWERGSKALQRFYDDKLPEASRKYNNLANSFIEDEFFNQ